MPRCRWGRKGHSDRKGARNYKHRMYTLRKARKISKKKDENNDVALESARRVVGISIF